MPKRYNPTRFTIPKCDDDHTNMPCWVPTTDGKNKLRPLIRCECGAYLGIGRHHIHRDGTVTDSIYHKDGEPLNGCGWHVHVTLGDWTGEEYLPERP